MGGIYEIDGVRPVIDARSFVHPDAVVIGDVVIGADCYIGAGAILRGDLGRIDVGAGSNIQDNCVVHSFPERRCSLESPSHVSHGAVLHGCVVRAYGFIGIGAVVMDDAVIGENAMVAAKAFVKAGFQVPSGMLVAGMPAVMVRELSETERSFARGGVLTYQQIAKRCLATLRATEPLREVEPNRPRLAVTDSDSAPLHERKREPGAK